METTSLSGGDRQQHHPDWWPKPIRRWRCQHRRVCEEWDETWNLERGTIRPEERWLVDLRSQLSGGICHDGECNSSKGGQVEAPYYSMTQFPLFARYNSEGKFLNSLPDLLQTRALTTCTTFTSSDGEEVLLVNFFLLEPAGQIIISPCQDLIEF